MKFIERTCIIDTFALILVVYSIFPHENSVSLRVLNTCSLKRLIWCNSDNSVQTDIFIGSTCSLGQTHVLNEFLRSNYHYKHCFANTTLSSLAVQCVHTHASYAGFKEKASAEGQFNGIE